MVRRLLVTLALVLPWTTLAAQALAPVRIGRLARPPVIDGTLRDSVWRQATLFTDFRTLHPAAGKDPSVRTEVRIGYDSANLYVAIRSFEDSARVRAAATSPDGIGDDDWAAFCIDSRAEAIGAFYFVVTPAGVRLSGVLDYDGDPTATRPLRWAGAATRDGAGYAVTMAIPVAQLPYASGDSVVMAFKAARGVAYAGEEDDAPEIRTDRAHVAQFRRIVLAGLVPSGPGVAGDDGLVADLRDGYRAKVERGRLDDYDTFRGRVDGWKGASVLDYLVFPSRPLRASTRPYRFPRGSAEDARGVVGRLERIEYLPGHPIAHAYRFLTRTQTQAFIVVRNDTVLYERYFNGFERDSMMTSFSVAKSFASTLVGIAIAQGRIHAVTDPITRYLPELERRDTLFRRITVGDLMHMASGLRYVEDEGPKDNDVTYLETDLRRAALERTEITGLPGALWHYNNYNPLLMGMILERAAGEPVTDLLQRWLWEPLGMEYGGSWSLDSRAHGLEKMESGINGRAIDFAKLGALFLHHGTWRGRHLVPAAWVEQATQPREEPAGFYDDDTFWTRDGHFYGWWWWGSRRAGGENDFYAVGNKGEYIYCSPQKHLVIVRTGFGFGIPSATWMRIFYGLADQY